ncbi:MAG TPA: hypothetical protein PKO06_05815 [Candidatus Ozemobacteraceae bacterium]|nr:hypothetical protein [Candidatus Ozemobacteraceae bacterium]
MKRLALAVTLSSFFLFHGTQTPTLWAGAYDQLIDIGGPPPDVPMPTNPTPVDPSPDNSNSQDNSSTSSYNSNSSSDSSSSSSYSSSSDSSSSSSGYSSPSYSGSDSSSNTGTGRFLWGLFDPPSPEELERQRQAREQRRIRRKQEAEKRRQQREERRRKEKSRERKKKRQEEAAHTPQWPQGLPKPRPSSSVNSQRQTPPSLQPPTSNVPAGTEAKTLREYLLRIDILRKKSPLSPLEQSLLTELETATRQLWIKASAIIGLTPEERAKLAMSLPIGLDDLATRVGTVTRDALSAWKRNIDANKPPKDDLMVQFNTDKTIALVEYEGSEFAERNLPEEIASKYDTMLGVGKVSIALKKGDRVEAVKESLDMLVGKIGMPQASWAVEGGRMYANVGFKTLDRFMTDAMAAVGVNFDTKEFWQKFQNDLTFGQKCVYKWIGGPDANE